MKLSKKFLLMLILTLFLIVYFVLCLLAFPVADDFTISMVLKEHVHGVKDLLLYLRNSWSGRYSSHLLSATQPYEYFGITGYRLALMFTLALMSASIWIVIRSLFINGYKKNSILIGSLWFMLLYLHIIPGPEETVYWWSGANGYSWAIIFHSLWLTVMIRWSDPSGNKTNNTILLVILSMIVCGFNEISMLLTLIMVVLFVIIPSVLKRKTDLHQFILIFAVVAVSFFIVSAPGNEYRTEYFTESRSFFTAMKISLISLAKLNGIALQSPSIVLTVIFLFTMLNSEKLKPEIKKMISIHPVLFAILWQSVLFSGLFVQAWAMGINPPMRVYNLMLFFWLSGCLLFVSSVKHYLVHKNRIKIKPIKGFALNTMVLLILLSMILDFRKPPGTQIVFGGNFPAAIYDIIYHFQPYKNELHQRNYDISHQIHMENDTIRLSPLKHKPKVVFYLDISENPDYFVNILAANALDVKAVKLNECLN